MPAGRRLVPSCSSANMGSLLNSAMPILAQQDNRCLICWDRLAEGSKKTHVDHCHDTGRIRGILSHNCNVAEAFYGTPKTLGACWSIWKQTRPSAFPRLFLQKLLKLKPKLKGRRRATRNYKPMSDQLLRTSKHIGNLFLTTVPSLAPCAQFIQHPLSSGGLL